MDETALTPGESSLVLRQSKAGGAVVTLIIALPNFPAAADDAAAKPQRYLAGYAEDGAANDADLATLLAGCVPGMAQFLQAKGAS